MKSRFLFVSAVSALSALIVVVVHAAQPRNVARTFPAYAQQQTTRASARLAEAHVESVAATARRRQAGDSATPYVGSTACQRCHENEYASWRRTLHVQMTKPVAEALVQGAFGDDRPVRLDAYGRSYAMERRDGRYFVSISHGGRPPEKFEVHYTLGARRFQGYLSKLPDGRIYVLPIFWHAESKRWLDWKEITPVPDGSDHDLRQIWNITCVNCHATNLVKKFDVARKTYETTWTEMGIACEACHGPGQAHIALMEAWETSPASKPVFDNSSKNRELGAILRIFSPKSASPREVFDTCGYCHGNKNNVFFGFKPGDRYEDYALPFLISQPIPANDPQGEFWPDGKPSRFNRPQAIMQTGCFQRGQATCTSCHTAHGSKNSHALKIEVETPSGGHTKQSDALCMQCHSAEAGRAGRAGKAGEGGGADVRSAELSAPRPGSRPPFDWTQHTHHAADSQGSRCIECHMSDVNWRLITRRRDHTFQPPVPELTAQFGEPNACTTCHDDKSPEWANSVMDRWYGNGDRRRAVVAMADIMYRAGAGDTAVVGEVARLAVDRSHAAPIRASAAEFVGQLLAKNTVAETAKSPTQTAVTAGRRATLSGSPEIGTPNPRNDSPGPKDPAYNSIVNSLIGAAADPEPIVRITAVRSLALMDDDRVLQVLAAHLNDPARLVRVAAAEGLLLHNVATLEGVPGQVLARAQDELAESLRTFNDVASDHTTLGRLEAARGRGDIARAELRTAIQLDPRDPRPYVYLGVLAARTGKYEEALQSWKTARGLAPNYPNLDRLIEEAQKRLTTRH